MQESWSKALGAEAMEFFTFACLYMSSLCIFIFMMLFGEASFFQGTPVAWLHSMLLKRIPRTLW